MSTVHESYGSGGAYGRVPIFLASLECEVEAIASAPPSFGNWSAKADNSLRNSGVEFISQEPRGRENLIADFKQLHKTLHFKQGEEAFSERTSTHVHINVSSIDTAHVRQIVLLYALFEEFFFMLVKPNRRDNIHCVPLTETHLPTYYKENLDVYYHRWSKYTALNLKRLADLGTLEFRHMHGTNNPEEIDVWVHVLENLWKVGQRISIDRASLKNKANILEWFDLIFFPSDKVMAAKPEMFPLIRNNLIDVKLSVAG